MAAINYNIHTGPDLTASQSAILLANQEIIRMMLYDDLCKEIDNNKKEIIEWENIFKNPKLTEFEEIKFIDALKYKYRFATIPELEFLIREEKTKYKKQEIKEETKEKSFILSTTIYLSALKLDEELLSSYAITSKSIEESEKATKALEEIERMKSEHYKKYGNWLERAKEYFQI